MKLRILGACLDASICAVCHCLYCSDCTLSTPLVHGVPGVPVGGLDGDGLRTCTPMEWTTTPMECLLKLVVAEPCRLNEVIQALLTLERELTPIEAIEVKKHKRRRGLSRDIPGGIEESPYSSMNSFERDKWLARISLLLAQLADLDHLRVIEPRFTQVNYTQFSSYCTEGSLLEIASRVVSLDTVKRCKPNPTFTGLVRKKTRASEWISGFILQPPLFSPSQMDSLRFYLQQSIDSASPHLGITLHLLRRVLALNNSISS